MRLDENVSRDKLGCTSRVADEEVAVNGLPVHVDVCTELTDGDVRRACRQVIDRAGPSAFHGDPRWLSALCSGLRHEPYLLVAKTEDRPAGVLPLALVKSWLFGRFLVSLPYVNSAGVVARDEQAAGALIDRAVALADQLDVRYLELRHEHPIEHPALGARVATKVHMRLRLPGSTEDLWKSFKPKVRNQIRKGENSRLSVHWGGHEILGDFYSVFARNMRDLGTPVFSRAVFRNILSEFPREAELCLLKADRRPVAAALLVHGDGCTQVPSASSLRRYNPTNANMLMYWHLLCRAIERGQDVFDFGRSSRDSGTFRFKKQWGASPEPAVWQYYVRKGHVADMRPEGGKYDRMIRLWRRLPVWLTRFLGPPIVRGIP